MTPGKLREVQEPTRKGFAFGSTRVNTSKIKDYIKVLDAFWSQSLSQSQISPDNIQIAITQKQDILSLDYIQDFSRMSKNKAPRILERQSHEAPLEA